MQNLYPLFESNRILKKELLWSLRDYSFAQTQLEYEEYAEGILCGCEVKVEEDLIVVSPGMIKYGGFIYLMKEEERISYGPCDEYVAVKMLFHTEQVSHDYIRYQMELVSNRNTELKDGVEVCRYKLQEGAALRDKHTALWDMDTEYNTLNYIYATWGGIREKTMAPIVTRRFAREILGAESIQPEDIQFAYLCLSQPGAVAREILTDYLTRKNHKKKQELTNGEIFQEMCRVIRQLQSGVENQTRERTERKKIAIY